MLAGARKKSKNDKRRFSDEQIRSLEMIFETESKLEPRKKVEVARELGLQPRQVAIWFQNKRARWKSNHIHNEYSLLLNNYNNLSAQFESLNKENHSLQIQLQKLKKDVSGKGNEEGGARNGESEEWNKSIDLEVMKNGMVSVSVSDSDDIDSNINAEEKEFMRMVDTSDWGSLDSDDIIINQSNCQWWDFWS